MLLPESIYTLKNLSLPLRQALGLTLQLISRFQNQQMFLSTLMITSGVMTLAGSLLLWSWLPLLILLLIPLVKITGEGWNRLELNRWRKYQLSLPELEQEVFILGVTQLGKRMLYFSFPPSRWECVLRRSSGARELLRTARVVQYMNSYAPAWELAIARWLPSGIKLSQEYDQVGQLVIQQVNTTERQFALPKSWKEMSRAKPKSPAIRREYQYDKASNLTEIKDGQWGTTRYTYDAAERLIQALRKQEV